MASESVRHKADAKSDARKIMKRAFLFIKLVKTMRLVWPLCICLTALSRNVLAAEHLNLLRLTSEDNSPFQGCYGDALAQTPNLGRLAAKGVRYRRAFANAPVCSSSRTTLMS